MGSIAGLPNQLCRLVLAGWLTLAGAANIDTRLRGDVDPTDIAGLVIDHGYPLEKHWVTTDDGYVLQVFRIPQYNTSCCPPTVLLQHGLLDSAAAWVLNLPHQSLAFMLHDAGYDVWLGNVRGSTWGLQHTHLDPSDDAFWQFTFDDMASKDIPAMVQHVTTASCAASVSYVGHSQGTMIALEALAAAAATPGGDARSAPMARVGAAVLLAPVAFPRHTTSVLLRMLAGLDTPRIVARFGVTSFLPAGVGSVFFFTEVCQVAPTLCIDFLDRICGPSTALNETRLPLYLQYVPAGTSVMNMEHWGQAVRERGRLALWGMDFGDDCDGGPWPGTCNARRYPSGKAPEFHLHRIRVPLALLSGDRDVLAPPTDVELLREVLPEGTVVFAREYGGYAHLDFTLGTRAHVDVYPDVLRVLAQYAHRPGTCGGPG